MEEIDLNNEEIPDPTNELKLGLRSHDFLRIKVTGDHSIYKKTNKL